MKRLSKEFPDPYLTDMLLISLVQLVQEYGSVMWFHCHSIYVNSSESGQ